MGVWLVENYRNSFAQEIGANGIDGLIGKLAERNKSRGQGLSAPARAARADAAASRHADRARSAQHAAHAQAGAARSEGGESAVVVDAGPLQRFDSSALAVLLEIERHRRRPGAGPSRSVGVPAKLAALAKLYGVDALLLKAEGRPAQRPLPRADQRKPAT